MVAALAAAWSLAAAAAASADARLAIGRSCAHPAVPAALVVTIVTNPSATIKRIRGLDSIRRENP